MVQEIDQNAAAFSRDSFRLIRAFNSHSPHHANAFTPALPMHKRNYHTYQVCRHRILTSFR